MIPDERRQTPERALLFCGPEELLRELAAELEARKIPHELGELHTFATATEIVPILTAVAGGGFTLLAQAVIAFLNRKKGQRRVVVQTTGADGTVRRIEIEAPSAAEVAQLLAQAREVQLQPVPPPAAQD